MSDRALLPANHETRDVTFRVIAALFALTATLLLLLAGLAWWMFPREAKDHRFTAPFPDWPAPRLQTDPAADMRQLRAAEMARLNGTGRNDTTSNSMHIPIDQAMRIIATEGLPDWPVAKTQEPVK